MTNGHPASSIHPPEPPSVDAQILPLSGDDPITFISQELRTPLNSIRGVLDLLRREELVIDRGEKQALLAMALRNTERLVRLVEALEQTDAPTIASGMPERLQQVQLALDLERAWKQQEFQLFYQPLVHLPTHTLVGIEAIARWQHPTHGQLPLDRLLPSTPQTPCIDPLNLWVFQQACQQFQHWQQQFFAGSCISLYIKLSGCQFIHPHLTSQIQQILRATAIAPHQLVLEVTEPIIRYQLAINQNRLDELQSLGVRLALDEFNPIHSTVGSLKSLPINTLKIERTLIENQKWQLIKTIIYTLKSIDVEVIFKGIETESQRNCLVELGSQTGQGAYFSQSLAQHDFEHFLKTARYC